MQAAGHIHSHGARAAVGDRPHAGRTAISAGRSARPASTRHCKLVGYAYILAMPAKEERNDGR